MKRWLSNIVALIWGRRPEPEALPPELTEMQRQYEEARAYEERLVAVSGADIFPPDFIRGLRDAVQEPRQRERVKLLKIIRERTAIRRMG